jgi:hypothetical protein
LSVALANPQKVCPICHDSSLLRITIGHLRRKDHRGVLLPGEEDPANDQLMLAYKRLAGLDETGPANSYSAPVQPAEGELYRTDPIREKRLGITDRILCRECLRWVIGRLTGSRGHLEICHGRLGGAREYRRKWPSAPVRSLDYGRKEANRQNEKRSRDREGERERDREHYARHPEMARVRAKKWAKGHADDRRGISRRYAARMRESGKVKEYQRSCALLKALKVTPERLAQLLACPEMMRTDGLCVCLGPHCQGRIIKTHIDKHLWAHNPSETWTEYQAKHPGALRAPTGAAAPPIVKIQQAARAKRLPDDSGKKPLWWRVAGDYLLANPRATNLEVAIHMERIGVRRDKGKNKQKPWPEALRSAGVMNDFSDVRKWVRVPGRIAGKPSSI